MQRAQRQTRNNNQINRQFVAGGVISNFTGAVPEPVPAPTNVSYQEIIWLKIDMI